VLVVPVREEVFAAARKLHVYALPVNKSTSDCKYIAFYRGAPISAITHYAPVETIRKNVSYQEVFPSGSEIVASEDVPLKVYHLGPLKELEVRVKKGWSSPISGIRYTKLQPLLSSKYLDQVWPPETEDARKKHEERIKKHEERKRLDEERSAKADQKAKTPKKRRRGGRKRGKKPKDETPKTDAPEEAPPAEKVTEKKKTRGRKKKKADEKAANVHYIVDGSNVAMEAKGPRENGRLKQIELVLEKLQSVKGAAITVIVDAGLRHHIDRKDDLEQLIDQRKVLQAPAQTDADEFILLTAEYHRSRDERVIIITNDRYKDYIKKYKPRFDWVHGAQQQFMFVFTPDAAEPLEAIISFT
jgi:hypothetical protein